MSASANLPDAGQEKYKELPSGVSPDAASDSIERWRPLWWLVCELALQVPIAHFTVGELLRLRAGSLVSSTWSRGSEVPLYVNGQRIGSGELEAVSDHIGARITDLD